MNTAPAMPPAPVTRPKPLPRTTNETTQWSPAGGFEGNTPRSLLLLLTILALSGALSALAALGAGILVRVNGESLASATLVGASAFATAFLLALSIITVVHLWTARD